MSENKASDWSNFLNTAILTVLSVGGVGGGLAYQDELKGFFMTREYHDQDIELKQAAMMEAIDSKLEPVIASANAAESNGLPPRIQNLLKMQCSNPQQFSAMSLESLLARLRNRYAELNDREYRIGECRDGVYYNSLGVRID